MENNGVKKQLYLWVKILAGSLLLIFVGITSWVFVEYYKHVTLPGHPIVMERTRENREDIKEIKEDIKEILEILRNP